MSKSPLNIRHPFFRPRYRRVLTTGFTALWAGFELYLGNPGWAVFFAAIAAFCFYEFFVVFDAENYEPEPPAGD